MKKKDPYNRYFFFRLSFYLLLFISTLFFIKERSGLDLGQFISSTTSQFHILLAKAAGTGGNGSPGGSAGNQAMKPFGGPTIPNVEPKACTCEGSFLVTVTNYVPAGKKPLLIMFKPGVSRLNREYQVTPSSPPGICLLGTYQPSPLTCQTPNENGSGCHPTIIDGQISGLPYAGVGTTKIASLCKGAQQPPQNLPANAKDLGEKTVTHFGPNEPNDKKNGLYGDSQTAKGIAASGLPIKYSPDPNTVGSAGAAGVNAFSNYPPGTVLAIQSPNDGYYHAYVVVDTNNTAQNTGAIDMAYPFPSTPEYAATYYSNNPYYQQYINDLNSGASQSVLYRDQVNMWSSELVSPNMRQDVILLSPSTGRPYDSTGLFDINRYRSQLCQLNNNCGG